MNGKTEAIGDVHLCVCGLDDAGGRALGEEVCQGDEAAQCECDGGEEAKDRLQAVEGVVHDGRGFLRVGAHLVCLLLGELDRPKLLIVTS